MNRSIGEVIRQLRRRSPVLQDLLSLLLLIILPLPLGILLVIRLAQSEMPAPTATGRTTPHKNPSRLL